MGKNNKTNKSERFVTVGESAYSFYDAATGINVVKGEKKKLSPRQLASPKIKRALSTGHLVYAAADNKPVEKYNEDALEKMKARFDDMVSSGMEASKIAQAFNLEQITKIAAEYEITPDEGDTVQTVVEAIIADVEGTSDDNKE